MAFVKLDTSILDSTLWFDRNAREVFVTGLLMAQPREFLAAAPVYQVRTLERVAWDVPPGWYGFIEAAGPGIVARAGVDPEAGLAALERLGEPDLQSRSPEFDGRRLVRVSGGYLVLNFIRYRDRDHSAADRARRYRLRHKGGKAPDPSRRDDTEARDPVGKTTADAAAEAAPAPKPSRRDDTQSHRDAVAEPPKSRRDAVAPTRFPVTCPPNVTQAEAEVVKELTERSAREGAVAERFPPDYRGDVETAIGASLNPEALERELAAMLDGMPGHGSRVDPEALGRAVRDLLLAGGPITGLRLRAFANGAGGLRRRVAGLARDATLAPTEDLDEFQAAARELAKERAP